MKLAVWCSITKVDGANPLKSTKPRRHFLVAFLNSNTHQIAKILIFLVYILVTTLNLIKLLAKMTYEPSDIWLRKLRLTLNFHLWKIDSLQNIIISIDLPLVQHPIGVV